MDVLTGAAALIGKHRPAMVIEYVKSDAEKLRQWLEALDYRVLPSGINFVAIHNSDPGLTSIQVKG
jgi:histidinol-phosphate/aromatic aminotransferase/cobyric acid decarboxylase-like protein